MTYSKYSRHPDGPLKVKEVPLGFILWTLQRVAQDSGSEMILFASWATQYYKHRGSLLVLRSTNAVIYPLDKAQATRAPITPQPRLSAVSPNTPPDLDFTDGDAVDEEEDNTGEERTMTAIRTLGRVRIQSLVNVGHQLSTESPTPENLFAANVLSAAFQFRMSEM